MDPSHAEIEQLKMQVAHLQQIKIELESELQNQTIELKYALFDAEATKREINYLKKLLDDNTDE